MRKLFNSLLTALLLITFGCLCGVGFVYAFDWLTDLFVADQPPIDQAFMKMIAMIIFVIILITLVIYVNYDNLFKNGTKKNSNSESDKSEGA